MDLEQEVAALRATVRDLQDRQAIRDCILRECRGRDRQDVDIINSCWWEDGVDEHGPIITRAPDYAARANMGHGKFFLSTSHNITNHLCEIDGDTAYCESYTVGGLFWQDGKTTTIAFGRYIDQLERRGGEWRLLAARSR
jgi:SnoaL-like domain